MGESLLGPIIDQIYLLPPVTGKCMQFPVVPQSCPQSCPKSLCARARGTSARLGIVLNVPLRKVVRVHARRESVSRTNYLTTYAPVYVPPREGARLRGTTGRCVV